MAKDKRVKKELADHKKVALDTSVFIHHFEVQPFIGYAVDTDCSLPCDC